MIRHLLIVGIICVVFFLIIFIVSAQGCGSAGYAEDEPGDESFWYTGPRIYYFHAYRPYYHHHHFMHRGRARGARVRGGGVRGRGK